MRTPHLLAGLVLLTLSLAVPLSCVSDGDDGTFNTEVARANADLHSPDPAVRQKARERLRDLRRRLPPLPDDRPPPP